MMSKTVVLAKIGALLKSKEKIIILAKVTSSNETLGQFIVSSEIKEIN